MCSPVERVVRTLVERDGRELRGRWRVVVDCDVKAVGQLLRDVEEKADIRHLFVRSGLAERTLDPWFALVEGIVGRGPGMGRGAVVDVRNAYGAQVLKQTLERIGRLEETEPDASGLWIPEEIFGREEMCKARAEFVRLAKLEDDAVREYERRFSRLVGGCRPVIVVFDDYNNFIEKVDGVFRVDRDRYMEGGGSDEFEGYLKCHCATLNNLGIVFSVEAPTVRMADRRAGVYGAVSEVLPFGFLDGCRDRIGAFVVDLEWTHGNGGAQEGRLGSPGVRVGGGAAEDVGTGGFRRAGPRAAGLAALRLVAARYPEVPAFVYTGQWSERGLLEGLVHGASWCFQKRKSHHPPYIGKERKALRSLSLEEHLTRAVEMRCGAFADPPDPELLRLANSDAGRRLGEELGIGSAVGARGDGVELQRLVGSLFPGAATVELERVVSSGRSRGLLATFVAKVDQPDGGTARRFVKVAAWAAVVGEWMAWRRVIEPRMSSHVAQIVAGPVMVEGPGLGQGRTGEPKGAVAYGLVGFPEGGELRSLGDRLREARGRDDLDRVKEGVRDTYEHVLRGLYRSRRRVVRSVWSWLGNVLPPVVTGVLVPLGDGKEQDQWNVRGSRWVVADRSEEEESARDAVEFVEKWKTAGTQATPWEYPEEQVISLDGFEFCEAATGGHEDDFAYLTVRHPVLGFRARLRGQLGDVRDRFGAAWVKPGMTVHVRAVLDGESSELGDLREGLESAAAGAGFESAGALLERVNQRPDAAVDPFQVFGYCSDEVRLQRGIEALEGPIHGDLNLENLMFSSGRGPAWLVDFDSAVERGMVAFDLAKLEVEIWNHEIFPLLQQRLTWERAPEVLGDILGYVDEGAQAGGENRIDAEFDGPDRDRLHGLLAIVCRVRTFLSDLGVTQEEAGWARSAYAFASLKFLEKERVRVLAYAASSWYLSSVAPSMEGREAPFRAVGEDPNRMSMSRCMDAFVLEAGKKCCDPAVVCSVAGTPIGWTEEDPGQRWDVVSTGSMGVLAELVGHLWLFGRALGDRRAVAVPKLGSRGESLDFVDVLESGGYAFARSPQAVRRQCAASGSSVAHVDRVAPVLDELRRRRRIIGAMKNDALTYLSVMSGLVAGGCTHAVVDVKEFVGESVGDCLRGDVRRRLQSFLEEMGAEVTGREEAGWRWLVQRVEGLGALREVRWCSTNGDSPQGRAIGGLIDAPAPRWLGSGFVRGRHGGNRSCSMAGGSRTGRTRSFFVTYCQSCATYPPISGVRVRWRELGTRCCGGW